MRACLRAPVVLAGTSRRIRGLAWIALACSGASCIPAGDPYPENPSDPTKCAPFEVAVGGTPPCSGEPDSWCPTATAPARALHTMVWTGAEAIVWGGTDAVLLNPPNPLPVLNSGGRYDPAADTWRPTSTDQAPSARYSHTAVWTGAEMIVWGGLTPAMGGAVPHNTGALYDPGTDTWRPMSTAGAPAPRSGHAGVWTGTELIVWGGFAYADDAPPTRFNDGGRYDPTTDAWRPVATAGAPEARETAPSAVWTGTELILWGGAACDDLWCFDAIRCLRSGGRYDPLADEWTPMTESDAPSGRAGAPAVWTGSEMVVWGGGRRRGPTTEDDIDFLRDGARYDPANDRWTSMTCTGAPEGWARTVWTGAELIAWGGMAGSLGDWIAVNTGGRYDPVTDTWTPLSSVGAPPPQLGHAVVWTGREVLVWGGADADLAPLSTGTRYIP